jgi:hypothetical protein
MTKGKIITGVAVLALAFGTTTAGVAAGGTAPKRATIKVKQKLKMKPNRYIQDGLRWDKDIYRVRHNGTLHVVNTAADEGPHTFTVVKKKDLPTNIEELFSCKICAKLGEAHGADPNSDAPPKFQFLENGVGENTGPPNLDRPGDSGVFMTNKKGEKISFKVTAKKGKDLYFVCLIHPWMQAELEVG